jgi:hypothetical protein
MPRTHLIPAGSCKAIISILHGIPRDDVDVGQKVMGAEQGNQLSGVACLVIEPRYQGILKSDSPASDLVVRAAIL